MRVLMLGAPGSGKGTHGPRIAERYAIPYVSTGEMLRRHIRDGTPLGQAAKPYVDQGDLVPDDLILSVVLGELAGPRSSAGYVLDGFPRTLAQALAADKATAEAGGAADAVVFLDVPHDELKRRLAERARVSGRADDQAQAVVRQRMIEFEDTALARLLRTTWRSPSGRRRRTGRRCDRPDLRRPRPRGWPLTLRSRGCSRLARRPRGRRA